MMTLSNIILMLWMAFIAPAQTKWVVQESSSLSVNGSTNVNKFTCDIPTTVKDTITLTKTTDGVKMNGSISPATLSFDCHKAMMTRDLQKTLKAKQYPNLHIRFLNLSAMPELSTNTIAITGDVELEIAGTKKTYSINYQISADENKMIHLSGSQEICFSDLKLVPPQKMGGIIKTKDQLVINFHLKMKVI